MPTRKPKLTTAYDLAELWQVDGDRLLATCATSGIDPTEISPEQVEILEAKINQTQSLESAHDVVQLTSVQPDESVPDDQGDDLPLSLEDAATLLEVDSDTVSALAVQQGYDPNALTTGQALELIDYLPSSVQTAEDSMIQVAKFVADKEAGYQRQEIESAIQLAEDIEFDRHQAIIHTRLSTRDRLSGNRNDLFIGLDALSRNRALQSTGSGWTDSINDFNQSIQRTSQEYQLWKSRTSSRKQAQTQAGSIDWKAALRS